jgi:AraC-like DNA-binding protein
MNTLLNQSQDWLELARRSNWSASSMAALCGVSVRTLERYFLKTMGMTPKKWLEEQRQNQAVQLLRDGSPVKETAARVGFKHAQHFSREFKKHWGSCPTAKGSFLSQFGMK